jgi:hypothetical protein
MAQAERPVARTRDLIVKTVGDEVLVYDLARHRAHSLNPTAAAVWRQCDGHRDAAAIAAVIQQADGAAVSEKAVHYALAQLGRARLIAGAMPETGVTRRDVVRSLGAAAALLPVVMSLAAPTPAQAQSVVCADLTGFCQIDAQCCAGVCASIVCSCQDVNGTGVCLGAV